MGAQLRSHAFFNCPEMKLVVLRLADLPDVKRFHRTPCGSVLESHLNYLALLRKHCPLPVLFTVRSKAEGGAFDGTEAQARLSLAT